MTKVVVYPKGLSAQAVYLSLVAAGEVDLSNMQLIQDTTDTLKNLLIYDKPMLDHRMPPPSFDQR